MAGQYKGRCPSLERSEVRSSRFFSSHQHTVNIRRGVLFLLVCGSATDFLSKVIYQLISSVEYSIDDLEMQRITGFLLTILCFIASAVLPMINTETRNNIWSFMTWKCLLKVMIPSVLDLLVTGARYQAIVLISPSIVSIGKTSIQLVTLTIISMCCRKKLSKKRQFLAILGVMVGNLWVSWSTLFGKDSSKYDKKDRSIGLVLTASSGVLGAIRNTIEEILLQDDGMKDSTLLFLESMVSFFFAVIAGVLLVKVFDPNIRELFKAWTITGVIPSVCMFVLFMYGRDLGKLKLTKYSSAITAKIVALVFPFGTWTLMLLLYLCVTNGKNQRFGSSWNVPWSFLRLAGYVTIIVSVWFFKFAAQARKLTKQTILGSDWTLSDDKISLINEDPPQRSFIN